MCVTEGKKEGKGRSMSETKLTLVSEKIPSEMEVTPKCVNRVDG